MLAHEIAFPHFIGIGILPLHNMIVMLVERIKVVCEFGHILYFAITVHLTLLILSSFPVLVGQLEPDGAVVLFLSTIINFILLSTAVSLLLFCRWYSNRDSF